MGKTSRLLYNGHGMPRLRPRGMLDRSASASLFKHTLSHIPTTYGKLAYLASLRDPHSGTYRHHGLVSMFGREDSLLALETSHAQVFQEWLLFPLAEKHRDLMEFLEGLDQPRESVLRHWARSNPFRSHVPETASAAEKELFSKELEILVEALNPAVAAPPGPGSWQLR
jgi:hypothetical protein